MFRSEGRSNEGRYRYRPGRASRPLSYGAIRDMFCTGSVVFRGGNAPDRSRGSEASRTDLHTLPADYKTILTRKDNLRFLFLKDPFSQQIFRRHDLVRHFLICRQVFLNCRISPQSCSSALLIDIISHRVFMYQQFPVYTYRKFCLAISAIA